MMMCSNIVMLVYFILINMNVIIASSVRTFSSQICISNSLELSFSDKRICMGVIDLCLGTFYSLHVANTNSATCEGKERD